MVTNTDRLTPHQMCYDYTGPADEFYKRLESVTLSVLQHKSVHDKFSIQRPLDKTYASLGTEIGTLNFYQMLIRIGGYREVLELGTFIGVSTMFLAEAVGWAGKVTTVESGVEFYTIAGQNIVTNGMSERIDRVLGNAVDVIKGYQRAGKKFDMIVLDAGKEAYDEMFFPALACLSEKGVLLVDDVFFQGETLNDTVTSAKGNGVKRVLAQAQTLDGYDKVILPMGNGLLMVRKSKDDREPYGHAN